MKTQLKNFCTEFSTKLDPFTARLDQAIGTLADKSGEEGLAGLKAIVADLQSVLSRSRTLQEKIANQHAYLLIFGPLKSGKSTLMNAISGAYVSEVSCLPTYPALVYVMDGEQNRFQAVTYTGEQREFADSRAMQAAIQQDHADLASAIRDAERAGEEFDPATHHPRAIRRVEVELPAPSLGESGTVLVDTPGLYSRMKFGYDQMTKDFRDAAACAIFVVKTDDLFFEKVFEEFEDLLGCFSQIFLVSNIDSSKQDLQPDGSLHVSLEGSDPGKVIEAFQSLSISAPIQSAIDSGRLNIYSIDLLKAAARRLSARQQGTNAEAASGHEASSEDADALESVAGTVGEATVADDGFDDFLSDLTNYLNSSNYLTDFMVDTLRTARDLVEDRVEASAEEIADHLKDTCKDLNAEMYKERHLVDALTELEKIEWVGNFAHLQDEKKQVFDAAEAAGPAQGGALQIALEEWMQNDESWRELIDSRLQPLLEQALRQGAEDAVERLRALLDSSNGGGRFSTSQAQAMSEAGLSVTGPVRELLDNLGRTDRIDVPELDLQMADVPLKLGVMDRVLFRNESRVREQLFGADGSQAIPAARKRKRLQGEGVAFLHEAVQLFVADTLAASIDDYADRVLAEYVDRYVAALNQQVSSLKAATTAAIRDNERKLRIREQVLDELNGIRAAAERFAGSLGGLTAGFVPQAATAEAESSLSAESLSSASVPETESAEPAGSAVDSEPGVGPSAERADGQGPGAAEEKDPDGVVIEEWPES